MHTRTALLLALAVSFPGSEGVAQMSRTALVRQSDIIFIGTVARLGASAEADVPASPRTVVVRVDTVLDKPTAVSLGSGDSVTVEATQAGSLKAGAQATFYTTGWIFGRGVAVREVGHELGHSPVAVAEQALAVAKARLEVNDTDLRAHIRQAAMVVGGRVEQVRPAELEAAPPSHHTRISEHDPQWQEAIIEVQDGIKNAQAGERVVVRFPASRDVAWVSSPRFTVGQEGTFLMHVDSVTGSPRAMLGGQSVPAYTALHKIDVLTRADSTRVRALMKQP